MFSIKKKKNSATPNHVFQQRYVLLNNTNIFTDAQIFKYQNMQYMYLTSNNEHDWTQARYLNVFAKYLMF